MLLTACFVPINSNAIYLIKRKQLVMPVFLHKIHLYNTCWKSQWWIRMYHLIIYIPTDRKSHRTFRLTHKHCSRWAHEIQPRMLVCHLKCALFHLYGCHRTQFNWNTNDAMFDKFTRKSFEGIRIISWNFVIRKFGTGTSERMRNIPVSQLFCFKTSVNFQSISLIHAIEYSDSAFLPERWSTFSKWETREKSSRNFNECCG